MAADLVRVLCQRGQAHRASLLVLHRVETLQAAEDQLGMERFARKRCYIINKF